MSRAPFRQTYQRPPHERDIADVRRGDRMLAPLKVRLASGDLYSLADWLRASPLRGADTTTRTLALMAIRSAGATRLEASACMDALGL